MEYTPALVLSLGANLTNASEILSGVDDVEDACNALNEVNVGFLPSPCDILVRLPVCLFSSSFGPMCPYDENERAA